MFYFVLCGMLINSQLNITENEQLFNALALPLMDNFVLSTSYISEYGTLTPVLF